MIPSILMNAAVVALSVAATAAHGRKAPMRVVLRYYTVLSNLLCAAACLAVVIARLCGEVPPAVLILKYVGTSAVTVTFLTVMLFLGPFVYDFKLLLTGPDLWLHLVCPVLAIVSLLLWDSPDAPFGVVFLGALPVPLYGAMYLYRVILAPPEKRWEDFYGFNRGGKWPLSLVMMVLSAFAVSAVLWVL